MAKKKSKKSKKKPDRRTRIWSMFSLGSAILGASVARKALDKSWKLATGKKPPANPADPDVDAKEAVTWAVTSATVLSLAKVLATRKAANYYARSTGVNPPPPKLPKKQK
jgi:hypothetical protein